MAKVHFRTNVLLKSILGKDLITDDTIAVLELVKNSFDANSKKVEIVFSNTQENDDFKTKNTPTTKTSKIIIKDTGIGMNEEDLIDKWLNIAYSEKKAIKEEYGRILAGNKGVGRFSCDKLGQFLNIYTRKRNDDILHLFIDWSKFEVENKKNLDIQKIELETEIIPLKDFKQQTGYDVLEKGTILEISKLRESWNAHKIIGLKRQLEKLINPNQAFKKNTFEIEIIAQEFIDHDEGKEDYEKINEKIKNKIFEKLDFRTSSIQSSITSNSKYIITILKDRGKSIFTLVERNNFPLLKKIKVHVYYLNPYSKVYFTKQTGIRSVDFGSISLFINGFRIPPYGDVGDDWLGLEIRKGQGYNRYLGTREIVGRIEINDNQGQFKIISSRTGVVNNPPFEQLTKSASPFGYFYKTFRRLERFVVEGIEWDSVPGDEKKLEKIINSTPNWKETKEIYNEDEATRNKRILSVIHNIIDAKKSDIVSLRINKEFVLEIAREQAENAKAELQNIIEQISTKKLSVSDLENFASKLEMKAKELNSFTDSLSDYSDITGKISKNLNKIQEKYTEEHEEIISLRQKLIDAEERERKIQEELEIEKQKNTYFLASDRTISEEAKGLIHNIIITAKRINSNIDTLYEKLTTGKIKQEEILARLSTIKFNAEKALKITQLITRANFKAQADKQYLDVAKFSKQYMDLYSDIYESEQLKFQVNNENASLERKLSILDLSLVFDNLISNSIKAEAKKVQLDISNPKKGHLKIIFSDSGRGVEKKFLDKIERIFELGVTTTDGSGIGMHSVRKTLDDMGASIKFIGNGTVLKGASFEIYFN